VLVDEARSYVSTMAPAATSVFVQRAGRRRGHRT
jgi:hypothetical protein